MAITIRYTGCRMSYANIYRWFYFKWVKESHKVHRQTFPFHIVKTEIVLLGTEAHLSTPGSCSFIAHSWVSWPVRRQTYSTERVHFGQFIRNWIFYTHKLSSLNVFYHDEVLPHKALNYYGERTAGMAFLIIIITVPVSKLYRRTSLWFAQSFLMPK